MIYENNSDLRDLLRRGVSGDAVHELLNATSFLFADVDFSAAVAEVKAQHTSHSDAQADARAAYRLLTKTKAPDSPVVARHSIFSKCFWSQRRLWAILRVAWAILILFFLLLIAARPLHGQALQPAAYRSRLGRGYPDAPSALIVQVSNQGTVLATRPAGLLKFDCQSGMSCSFSGVTFAMTATGSGGGVNIQVNAGSNLASPVNFQNGSAFNGLAINFSNPSGSNVQATLSGTATAALLPATIVYNNQANTYTAGAQDMSSAASFKVPVAAGAAPTANGDVRFDSTQVALVGGGAGAIKGAYPRVLATCWSNSTNSGCFGAGASTATNDNVTATGTGCTTSPGCAFSTTFQIPASYLIANKTLRISFLCDFDSSSTAASQLFTLQVSNGPTNIWQSSGTFAPSNSVSHNGFGFQFYVQGTGAAGSSVGVETGAIFTTPSGAGARGGNNGLSEPVSINTSVAETVKLLVNFGAATSGNTVRLRQMIVEEFN